MSLSLNSVTDGVGQVLASAMDGIALRQRTISDNIANVDTPGYRARTVDFESSLVSAIADGRFGGESTGSPALDVTATPTATPVGANGNNVDLRHETLAAVQSQYQYQLMSRAITDRFDVLKASVGGF